MHTLILDLALLGLEFDSEGKFHFQSKLEIYILTFDLIGIVILSLSEAKHQANFLMNNSWLHRSPKKRDQIMFVFGSCFEKSKIFTFPVIFSGSY